MLILVSDRNSKGSYCNWTELNAREQLGSILSVGSIRDFRMEDNWLKQSLF